MHIALLAMTVQSVKRRDAQGDCPTELPYSVEHLQDALLTAVQHMTEAAKATMLMEFGGPACPVSTS